MVSLIFILPKLKDKEFFFLLLKRKGKHFFLLKRKGKHFLLLKKNSAKREILFFIFSQIVC